MERTRGAGGISTPVRKVVDALVLSCLSFAIVEETLRKNASADEAEERRLLGEQRGRV